MDLAAEFLQSAIKRFEEERLLGEKTIMLLTAEELCRQPNETSNSIAVIVQHLHGNMLSRWTNFLTEDGEKEWRKRDAEFEQQWLTKENLLSLWNQGWSLLLTTLSSLQPTDLLKTVTIRTKPLLVVDAINRQLAHYSYHVGQIVYVGRWIKNKEWTSLSIPVGQSTTFNAHMKNKEK